jgi:hypothetical protein
MTSFIATVYVALPRCPNYLYLRRPEIAHEQVQQAHVRTGATTGETNSDHDPVASREQPVTSYDNMPRPLWEAAAFARS